MRCSAPLAALLSVTALNGCRSPSGMVSTSVAGAYEASLAVLPDGLAVAWHDVRDGNAEIYYRRLDPDGRPFGDEHRVTHSAEQSYEASIDAVGANLAVAWYEKPSHGPLAARLGVWAIDGRRLWSHPLPPGTRNPIVRAARRGVFCAWIQADVAGAEHVWSGWWDRDGTPIESSRALAPASTTTWNVNAALDDRDAAWVVFDAAVGTRSDELFLVRSVPGEEPRPIRVSADDGMSSRYPDIAIDGERAALTWWDERDGNAEIYLWTADVGRLSGEVDRVATRITTTPGESIGAYLAWNDGNIGLAWSDDSEGQHEVYFQRYDRTALPVGPRARLTDNATASLVPAIRPWRSGFALAWNEYAGAGHDADNGHGEHGGPSEVAAAIVR